MNPVVIASTIAVVLIGAILAGVYRLFFLLAVHIPPGRTLGMVGAALMVGGGLACAAVGYLANQWLRRQMLRRADSN